MHICQVGFLNQKGLLTKQSDSLMLLSPLRVSHILATNNMCSYPSLARKKTTRFPWQGACFPQHLKVYLYIPHSGSWIQNNQAPHKTNDPHTQLSLARRSNKPCSIGHGACFSHHPGTTYVYIYIYSYIYTRLGSWIPKTSKLLAKQKSVDIQLHRQLLSPKSTQEKTRSGFTFPQTHTKTSNNSN